MAEVAVCIYRTESLGLALVGVARLASLLVLVFVVSKMLCSGTTFVLAIGGHCSPTELHRQENHEKDKKPATHCGPSVAAGFH